MVSISNLPTGEDGCELMYPASLSLLPDWPLNQQVDVNDQRYLFRVPHNLYSAGHLPFHLPTTEACPGALRRYAVAAAGETLRLLMAAHDAADTVGCSVAEWEAYRSNVFRRYGVWCDVESVAVSGCHVIMR